MKKKELLTILILAALVTGLGLFYTRNVGHDRFSGWPLSYRVQDLIFPSGSGHNIPPPIVAGTDWFWPNLLIDFFFWFVVLAMGWWILKFVLKKTKK